MRRLKQDLVSGLAAICGVEPPPMSTGSTEPRAIFEICAETIGIDPSGFATKPELARAVAEAGGIFWGADCESRGGTVTLAGLSRVEQSMKLLLGLTA